jgi:hypothetical protein
MLGRADIIQAVINATGARTYLEIGVAHGETLLKVEAANRIGIDPARPSPNVVNAATAFLSHGLNLPGSRLVLDFGIREADTYMKVTNLNHAIPRPELSLRYFQIPSDEFFTDHAQETIGASGIDVAFVDGLHEWRQAVRDVENCLSYLNDGGVIVMHDCSPTKEIVATPFSELEEARRRPDWDGTWTGDVFRAILWLRSQCSDLDVRVLDCDWGVGLVRRASNSHRLTLDENRIASFPFAEFAANRKELLNLHPPEHLAEYVKSLAPVLPIGNRPASRRGASYEGVTR